MGQPSSAQTKIFRVLISSAILGAVGIGVFLLLLKSWTTMKTDTQSRAEIEIARILADMEDSRPYLVGTKEGEVAPNRQLESDIAAPVDSLCLVVWNPKRERWVRTNFPYWFVRMKMRHGHSVTLLHAAAKEDWSHLLIDTSIDDLERRGPGLILHVKRPDGREILVWNESFAGNLKKSK
jgi:hypothetical protein